MTKSNSMTFHRGNSRTLSEILLSTFLSAITIGLILNNVSQVDCGPSTSVFDRGIPPDKSNKDKSDFMVQGSRGNGKSNSVINSKNVNLVENNNENNELHSPHFSFSEHVEEDDDDAREIEDGSYYDYDEDSQNAREFDFDKDETELINQHEHEIEPVRKPKIGKCCPYGMGLNVQGVCKPMNTMHLLHHEKLWFPDKVFDGSTMNMKPTNISEWNIIANHPVECGLNESAEIISDMEKFAILKDGTLYLAHHQKFVLPLEFCVEQELGKGEGRVVRSCFSRKDLCGNKNCLRKCCRQGAIVEEPSSSCSSNVKYTYQHLYHEDDNWTVIHATPSCPFGQHLQTIDNGYNISEDGSLVTDEFRAPFLHYCIDHFKDTRSLNNSLQLKALVCFEEDGTVQTTPDHQLIATPKGVSLVSGVAFIISAICLALAAAISWRLPELRSLHGKCQLSHLGTLFCLFFFLAIVNIGTDDIPAGLCTFLAVMIHMCALSSFMWLNLLCVNIYLTFRSLRPPLAARRDENRRLFFLCVYAWGIPAAFCAFLYILDSTPGRLDPMPQPQYGLLKCLISNRQAEFAYLFGPVGVLLLCNGILFCLTAQELLCGLWRLDNAESLTFRRKSMGIVVAKLGIVMGMGWILDVLSWAVGKDFPYMFYAADFFNGLQGVFICAVLIWRKRVLEVLHIRKPSLTKDETLTVRPFLPKNSINNSTTTQADHDTSLVIVQES